ncbi:basic proline-rich protein-like [Erinaceus europaeus]|uniref:Basic proline-rich protein-like n=1 Tax=Erinaceus europaeus TaxID=9365 RepID=A0ABM3X6L9_ERIEU|nr:basic proline-rich protein-like [Erinaceus europaeus]
MTVSREPPARRVTVSGEPPARRVTVSGEPPARRVTVSGEPPARRVTVSREPPARRVTVSREPPARRVTVSGEPPARRVTVSGEPSRVTCPQLPASRLPGGGRYFSTVAGARGDGAARPLPGRPNTLGPGSEPPASARGNVTFRKSGPARRPGFGGQGAHPARVQAPPPGHLLRRPAGRGGAGRSYVGTRDLATDSRAPGLRSRAPGLEDVRTRGGAAGGGGPALPPSPSPRRPSRRPGPTPPGPPPGDPIGRRARPSTRPRPRAASHWPTRPPVRPAPPRAASHPRGAPLARAPVRPRSPAHHARLHWPTRPSVRPAPPPAAAPEPGPRKDNVEGRGGDRRAEGGSEAERPPAGPRNAAARPPSRHPGPCADSRRARPRPAAPTLGPALSPAGARPQRGAPPAEPPARPGLPRAPPSPAIPASERRAAGRPAPLRGSAGCERRRPWPAPDVERRRRRRRGRHSRRAGGGRYPATGLSAAPAGRAPYPSAQAPGLHQRRPRPPGGHAPRRPRPVRRATPPAGPGRAAPTPRPAPRTPRPAPPAPHPPSPDVPSSPRPGVAPNPGDELQSGDKAAVPEEARGERASGGFCARPVPQSRPPPRPVTRGPGTGGSPPPASGGQPGHRCRGPGHSLPARLQAPAAVRPQPARRGRPSEGTERQSDRGGTEGQRPDPTHPPASLQSWNPRLGPRFLAGTRCPHQAPARRPGPADGTQGTHRRPELTRARRGHVTGRPADKASCVLSAEGQVSPGQRDGPGGHTSPPYPQLWGQKASWKKRPLGRSDLGRWVLQLKSRPGRSPGSRLLPTRISPSVSRWRVARPFSSALLSGCGAAFQMCGLPAHPFSPRLPDVRAARSPLLAAAFQMCGLPAHPFPPLHCSASGICHRRGSPRYRLRTCGEQGTCGPASAPALGPAGTSLGAPPTARQFLDPKRLHPFISLQRQARQGGPGLTLSAAARRAAEAGGTRGKGPRPVPSRPVRPWEDGGSSQLGGSLLENKDPGSGKAPPFAERQESAEGTVLPPRSPRSVPSRGEVGDRTRGPAGEP